MAPISFAKALGKAATAMTNLQSKKTKKPDEKPGKTKSAEDSADIENPEAAVQPAFPDQETQSSLTTDILPLIKKSKDDVPLVTRPNPIPLEVIKEETSDGYLPGSLNPSEAGKEPLLPETDPEPNVQMVADLDEIRSRKKSGLSQKPQPIEKKEVAEKKPGAPQPQAGISEKKSEIQEKKLEVLDQKTNLPEAKPELQDKKPEPPKSQPEVKASKPEDKNKTENVAGPDSGQKPPENTGDKSLFDNLFSKTEEKEETALDRLIKALPDISIEEVISEASEVNSLIADWNNNQTRSNE
jgi:hypothetical protein